MIVQIVGAVLVVALILAITRAVKDRKADRGSSLERRIESEVGMAPVGRAIRAVQDRERKDIEQGRAEAAAVQGIEKQDESSAIASEKQADKGAFEGAKGAMELERSAEALSAIEGRAAGLIAGLLLVERSIETYVSAAGALDRKEEGDALIVSRLVDRIGPEINHARIDVHAAEHVRELVKGLLSFLHDELGEEGVKEERMRTLMGHLRDAVREMREVIVEARREEGIFIRHERKIRGDYKREIRDLERAIGKKRSELMQARRAERGADRHLIAQLEREIALMRKQHEMASRLQSRIDVTFKLMDKEARESRRMIGVILAQERKLDRVEGSLERLEKRFSERIARLRDAHRGMAHALAGGKSGNVHLVALTLSGQLDSFLRSLADAQKVSVEFDAALKSMISAGFHLVRRVEAYEKLIDALSDAERAIAKGLEEVTRIIQSVVSDSAMEIDEDAVIKTLEDLDRAIAAQDRIEKHLEALLVAIEGKMRALYGRIEDLMHDDEHIAHQVRASSEHLGAMMGHMVDRKVAVDSRYMSKAERFEGQLKARNAAAANAYSEAREARSRR